MELNLTLAVQAVNFLCAYIILQRVLLKPAMACIEAERAYRAALESAIADRKVIVEQKQAEQEERWRVCQRNFAAHEPPRTSADEYVVSGISPSLKTPHLSEQEINDAVHQVVAVMKKAGDLS